MNEGHERTQPDGRHGTGSRRAALWILTGFLALVSPWGASAAPDAAYTVVNGQLFRLQLATAELAALDDVEIPGVEAVALSPSGILFAANRDELFTIDPRIPAATLVGSLGLGPSAQLASMTFDATGRLWLAVSGALAEVDPLSGAATMIGNDAGLIALADNGGELLGITHGIDPPPGFPPVPEVVRVDRTNGVVEVVAQLEDLEGEHLIVEDLDFDDQGHAWILVISMPPITPPTVLHRIYRADDLETGMVELVSERLEHDTSLLLRTMALAPDRGLVAIPTLGWGGLLMLCAALIGCALPILRRHSRKR